MKRTLLVVLAALALAACSGGGESPASRPAAEPDPGFPSGGDDPASLVYAWYAEVDPDVCDRMTDAMLDFGWELTGDQGRDECRASVGEAEPYSSVEVSEPVLSGDRADVTVRYDDANLGGTDVVTFVRVGDAWLIDAVRVAR